MATVSHPRGQRHRVMQALAQGDNVVETAALATSSGCPMRPIVTCEVM